MTGVCTVWTLVSGGFTALAAGLSIFSKIEVTPSAIFNILGEEQFTVVLTILYITILIMVAVSDTVALVYALKYR